MVKYPIGLQNFKGIRNQGYLYVDKTAFIPKLLESGKYYFLSRPRRFGKSLFLSTLEYFFKGERDLFKGLAIDTFEWDWREYPVIHLDLNGANYSDENALFERLSSNLKEFEDLYGLEIPGYSNLSERFRNLIYSISKQRDLGVVVLVDEYDKPVVDNLDHKELFEKNQDILRGFYSVLKSMDSYLEMVFFTGVTKFGQMNVFSGLNNIRDISLNPEYSTICGITEIELTKNFRSGLEKLAKKENTDFSGALELLKENYDGYHFSSKCIDIYNPYSLINSFADLSLKAYWSYTGTPVLLDKVLKRNNFDLEKLDGIIVGEDRLMGINNLFDDPATLFYQTGYLTIKKYDAENQDYTLGYPNKEVEQAFFKYLLPNYCNITGSETDSYISQLNRGLIDGNPQLVMEIMEEFSAGVSYDIIPIAETERHFQYMIYIITKLLASRKNYIKVEEKTSDGRIDLIIATDKYIYIIEIKRDCSPEDALAQIKEKEYYLQYNHDDRTTFLIGMNFSTGKKRLDGFSILPLTNL